MCCIRKDPCDILQNGIYYSPALPDDHNMTSEEIYSYLDIPEKIIGCISTEGLIESILNYKYISLIMAGTYPQTGYEMLKSKYRGIEELESRVDNGEKCLLKYQTINPNGFDKSWSNTEIGRYLLNIYYIEVISGQYIILQNMSEIELEAMFNRCVDVCELKALETDYHGTPGLVFSAAIMCRIMLILEFDPFINLYNSNQFIRSLTEEFGPVDSLTLELIYNTSHEMLFK